jgi:hypothetical protein
MSIDFSRVIPTLVLVVPTVAAAVGGCAGTLEDKARFFDIDGSLVSPHNEGGGPSCPDIPSTILVPHCAISGCHSAKDMMAMLDLESPDPIGRLTGQMAHGGSGVLIDPGGDPNKSILYIKLKPFPPFGSQMPLAGAKLDDATLACVASWISDSVHGGGGDAGEVDSPSSPGDDSGGSVPEASSGGDDSSSGGMDTGSPDDTGAPPAEAGGGATFTSVYAIIYSDCLPCHSTGGGKTNGKLDMSSKATAFRNLVGVAAAGTACAGKGTRVVAGNSAMSLLIQKLNPAPTCGKQMPSGMPALSSTPIALFAAWIDSGAPNN